MSWLDIAMEVAPPIVSILCALIVFIRTGSVKKIKEVLDEMKYKTVATAAEIKSHVQTFDDGGLRPVYRLNKSTGELEMTDEVINVQELVDSCKQYCLDACLERFMPAEQPVDIIQQDMDRYADDLDFLAEAAEKAEAYKEELGLDAGLTVDEVYAAVAAQADALKERLAAFKKPQQEEQKGGEDSAQNP